jgi:hypothetical protein
VERRVVFVAAASLFLVGAAVRSGPAVMASHAWGCYKWNSTSLTYNNTATSPYKTYYDDETLNDSDSWSKGTVIDFTAGTGGNNVKEMSGSYGQNGWLGLATIYTSGCTITRAETKVNRSYLDGSGYNTENKKTVACHEVGHSTGLAHNSSTTSCLHSGATTPSHPNAHDADELDIIY